MAKRRRLSSGKVQHNIKRDKKNDAISKKSKKISKQTEALSDKLSFEKRMELLENGYYNSAFERRGENSLPSQEPKGNPLSRKKKRQRNCDGNLGNIERPDAHPRRLAKNKKFLDDDQVQIVDVKIKQQDSNQRRILKERQEVQNYVVEHPDSDDEEEQNVSLKNFPGIRFAQLFGESIEDEEELDESDEDLLSITDEEEENDENESGDNIYIEEEAEFVNGDNNSSIVEIEDGDYDDESDTTEEFSEAEDEHSCCESEEHENEDDEDFDDVPSVISDVSSIEDVIPCGKIFEQEFMKNKEKTRPIDFSQFPFGSGDSSDVATRAFAWLIKNCDVQTFFENIWQQDALYVQRHDSRYYGNLFSVKQLTEVVEKHHVEYSKNINIAVYREGVRTTLNGAGRVLPGSLKQHLAQGCSVQLVNPQTFSDHIWYLCEVLQELFGCFVGANSYLTPAGSAGFAPHWDEIDAFLLQIEGRKYWKVYRPQSPQTVLPRESSGNFTDSDFANVEPCFEGWLEPGDLLYLPRGYIHQAQTGHDIHSFHVTVSVGRRFAFADMLDKFLPMTIDLIAASQTRFRKSLPPNILDMTGVAELEYNAEEQAEDQLVTPMRILMKSLSKEVTKFVPCAVDLMAQEFMRTALPPFLLPEEKQLSAHGSTDILEKAGIVIKSSTIVRFIRRHAQRLFMQSEGDYFIVHRMFNSRDYEGRPEQMFSIEEKLTPGFIGLQDAYPDWTTASELPLPKKDTISLIRLLYLNGLVLIKN